MGLGFRAGVGFRRPGFKILGSEVQGYGGLCLGLAGLRCKLKFMSYSVNFFQGLQGTNIPLMKGDVRSLDYSSCRA